MIPVVWVSAPAKETAHPAMRAKPPLLIGTSMGMRVSRVPGKRGRRPRAHEKPSRMLSDRGGQRR
jgi:hypothetical protein